MIQCAPTEPGAGPLVEQAVRMQPQDFLIDPSQGWSCASESWQPLGFVALDAWPEGAQLGALPPFPLIGLSDAAHPAAGALDAIVEPPVSADALLRQIVRAPRA